MSVPRVAPCDTYCLPEGWLWVLSQPRRGVAELALRPLASAHSDHADFDPCWSSTVTRMARSPNRR